MSKKIMVPLRLEVSDKKMIDAAAGLAGVKVSVWMRSALLLAVERSGVAVPPPVAKTQLKPIEDRLSRAREALSSVDPRYADMSNEPVLQYEE